LISATGRKPHISGLEQIFVLSSDQLQEIITKLIDVDYFGIGIDIK
jgi:hypothetical protein